MTNVIRKKEKAQITYNELGLLESRYFDVPVDIATSIGTIKAEFLTYYDNGQIEYLFPRYGKINAFWTEEDEYSLASDYIYYCGKQQLSFKPQCFHFYPDGHIQSFTIWNKQILYIKTKHGLIGTSVLTC